MVTLLNDMDDREKYAKKLVEPNYSAELQLISDLNIKDYQSLLRTMLKIRLAEQCLAVNRSNGKILGPVHLSAGQEAIAVGISHKLLREDSIFGAHRSHSHLLALGSNLTDFFAEILAKPSGLSGGFGGSMHLQDKQHGFIGSVPIVAGTVPLAVGAALAHKYRKNNYISVIYLGDGATEEGVFHESLNLASIMELPILFVIENNQYSSHMQISLRQPKISTARFASANSIENCVVDGNNIIEVIANASHYISSMRKDRKPRLIEAITFRHFGHVDGKEDIDVGVSRSAETISAWKKRDPIILLTYLMIKYNYLNYVQYEEIKKQIESEVDHSWVEALERPCFN